ncbi:MAG TPA: hypothetical protein DDZ83_06020 [Nitrospinae bacterium]|nr:hypothetical protein [Nitrospinota bacterium]
MRVLTRHFPGKVNFPGVFRVPQGAGAKRKGAGAEPVGQPSSGAGRWVGFGASGAGMKSGERARFYSLDREY